ncbi:hypothetical protein CBR_g31646 [Chara braunii]|uniref:Uncharacterized protein n=1 Tax=Chara braunii TaxID=69332 RepID=A0A388LFK4_CHABU|nr:hypothetical protein CBR_g31646 [Chara braunii]|eukprot:GBG81089.1 hypothetical protein CBR_g31646 [Chara braunii]
MATGVTNPAAKVRPTGGPVIGIDLGTSYCCVAVWQRHGVEVIANENGNRITPSYVAFTDSERLIGDAAKNQAAMNAEDTVYEVKRLIGRKFSDPMVQKDIRVWPFKVVAGRAGEPLIRIKTKEAGEKLYTPEEISAMLLGRMKEIAEGYLDCEVKDAVITVPAYFNHAQRRATKDAGAIAGLNVLRIANEPTAAALAYGLHRDLLYHEEEMKTVMVFDLGGGTCDVSVMEVGRRKSTVIALSGDTHLGGVDFDERLLNYVLELSKGPEDESILRTPGRLMYLRRVCVQAKHELSARFHTSIEVDPNASICVPVSRAAFEEINRDLFDKCIELGKQALEGAKIPASKVADVILVGGSTRIPRIQFMLKELFGGRNPKKSINPDEAVAYGAAVLGAILTADENCRLKDLTMVEVTALSFGVNRVACSTDTRNMWLMDKVIPRNTPIPATGESVRCTLLDFQTRMSFFVYEGERALCKDNHYVGKLTLSGLQQLLRGQSKAVLTLCVDEDGILHAEAREMATGKTCCATITMDKGRLSNEQVSKMIREAKTCHEDDEVTRKRWFVRNDLEEKARSVRARVKERVSSSPADAALEAHVEELLKWFQSQTALPTEEECEAKRKELEKKELEAMISRARSKS